jgi:formimidoylglutamate deiminase
MGLGAIFAEHALLPEGWAEDVLIGIGPQGDIAAVKAGAAPGAAFRAAGPVIPGMPNLHSHAFQRAMAGLTEQTGTEAGAEDDSFWTWRKLMYGFVGRLRPEQVEAIAGQLYVEMLKSGYTAVAEFHYLHHDPAGAPYGDLPEISSASSRPARPPVSDLPCCRCSMAPGASAANRRPTASAASSTIPRASWN